MVVMRESPRAKVSPDKNETAWPPKSPFQALLSSPSGRRKWQDHRIPRERSSSPSPHKGNAALEEEVLGEDDDEETLQLQLAAIQAKLKLKKLQQKKSKENLGGSSEKENAGGSSRRPASSPTKASFGGGLLRPASRANDIQVPLSPVRDRMVQPVEPVSPARRRLGLTADPKAENVSLKRARDGRQLQRNDSGMHTTETPKLSFSERLSKSRTEAQDKEAKQERMERNRSTGFGAMLNSAATSSGFTALRTTNIDIGKRPSSAHQIQSPAKLDHESPVQRSKSTRSSRPENRRIPRAEGLFANTTNDASTASQGHTAESPGFDDFSQVHLSKRHIPHVEVARAMEGKQIYPLPRLLKEVKAPDYDSPDCESDFVVFAILASKSTPFDQKSNYRTSDNNKPQEDANAPRNKFMVLHLCDGVKWEVDCFLFGSAFEQFWKLTPGTLLAILNPGIMPPKGNKHSGAFSLKLGSSEDCLLEIGIARDLGYCSSVKKDGTLCGDWVDKRKTDICEFHLNLEIERNRRTRMEVNTMGRFKHGAGERNRAKSYAVEKGGFDKQIGKGRNVKVDREHGRLYAMPSGGSGFGRKSAASLLDAEDQAVNGMSREEASRKRIAEAQRDRDLRKKLGEMGGTVGSEYLRMKERTVTSTTVTSSSDTTQRFDLNGQKTPYFEKPSASELGLLANKAQDQHLSPAKDRKRHFGIAAISSAGTEAIGWGGARKAGLLQPKENRLESPEREQTKLDLPTTGSSRPGIVRGRSTDGDGRLSPKKRARFALEKGIREPGRESLGMQQKANNDNDDDDDLDIV